MAGTPENRAIATAAFNANTAAVRAIVPPDRLIVHEVGDGWRPLCAGLNLPEPATPYPNINTTADFLAFHAVRNAGQAQS